MKRFTSLVTAVLVLATGLSTTRAADYYWDINGTNTGATDDANGVASGDVTGPNWNTASDGVSATPAAFVNGNRAIFSAGTNATASTVLNGMTTDLTGTLGTTGTAGVPAMSGMVVEEGEINVLGTLTIAGTSGATKPIVEVKGGATLTQPSVDIVSSGQGNIAANTIYFNYQLDGTTATLKQTNTGFAGSFISTSSGVVLNGGGTLFYGGPQINIFQTTSTISGTGPLIKDGGDLANGVLAIAGTCTYTGATIINAGELRIRTNANRLPIATDVTVNANGVFNLNSVAQQVGSVSGAGAVGLGSATLTINGTVNGVLDGPLGDLHNTGAGPTTAILGSLTKAGTNVQTFNGVNDLTGKVTLTSGGITVGASGSLCSDVADVVVNGGNLIMHQSAEQIENLSGTGGTIALDGILSTNPSDATTSNTTYAGTISGAGGLTKTNYVWESSAASSLRINLTSTPNGEYRTLTLTGANTYSGGTHVIGGGVRANNTTGSGLGTGPVTIDTAGKVDGSGTVSGAVTVNAGGHLGGGIGTANGTLLTASGAVTANAGGSIDALLGAAASSAGDYNGDNVVDASDYIVWRQNPAGFGGDPAGYNTWRNNFGNTYTGLGTSDRVNATGGVTLGAGSLLTIAGTGAAAPSGKYDLLDYSSHTGTLAGMFINNATGMELTSVTDNTVAKRIEAVVSSTAQVRSWAGAGDGNWSANPADAGNWSPSGQPNGPGATATFSAAGTHTVTITDSDKTVGTMNLNGSGYTIAATGSNQLMTNTYTGTPTINVTGNPTISAGFTPLKNTTISVANAGDNLTLSGFISNSAGFTKAGAGSVTVTGEIGSTGTVTVSGGTLNLMSNSIGSGTYTVAAGATLNALNSADGLGRSATGASAITNNGSVNIGDATHTGARIRGTITTASGGITNVTGGSLATQALLNTTTTQSGGTLTGTGWAGGMSFNGGSTLQPGGIGTVGTLNANGTVSFNPAVASAGVITMRVDCDGTGCDLLNIANNAAGTLVFPAVAGDSLVINVNALAGTADSSYTIINYNAGATATATNALAAVSVTGTAGHTYSLTLDTANKVLNLTITTPGSGSSLSGGSVPEPSSMVLLMAGLIATAAGRRRRAA